ncbi:MAG: PSD1 and planctomycete cytochrome C domain-containing protein [Armatimonadota bacterium]
MGVFGSIRRAALPVVLLAGAGVLGRLALAEAAPGELARGAFGVLERRCFNCHGDKKQGGLDLRTREAALLGGGRGAALVARDSKRSLLILLVSGAGEPAMPQGAPLAAAEVALLRRWIDAGAPYPSGAGAAPKEPQGHWAFQSPVRPAVPRPRQQGWARNPVDAFVLARLEARGLKPSPEADRLTLLRRVTLDLTGLPPTTAEIAGFLGDRRPDAYERAVDRLLASPRFGERWAQHWLDVVRFGETNGFELDGDRPQAWRYRDYVVRSLNEDRPYDRFLTEQIAGDLLDPKSFDLRVATGFLRAGPQHVVGGNQDEAVNRQEWLTEAVAGVGSAVMGLTIGCARCHDHKYDPVSQADYYRLQAFFAPTINHELSVATEADEAAYQAAAAAHQEKLKPIRAEIAELEKPYREHLRRQKLERLDPEDRRVLEIPAKDRTPEERKQAAAAQVQLNLEWTEVVAALSPEDRARRSALRARMHVLAFEEPEPLPVAPGVTDGLQPRPAVHVLERGDPHSLGAPVQPGFPAALRVKDASDAAACGEPAPGNDRLALARWLTRPDHPLTGRVLVNRVWHTLFGRGIVATPNDFGRNGATPTHRELLDYLASSFTAPAPAPAEATERRRDRGTERVRTAGSREAKPALRSQISLSLRPSVSPSSGLGWSLKRLVRLVVTSSTYRQASDGDARKAKLDPANELLWRQNRRRLDAEAVRDAVLTASGSLNVRPGGPSVRVPLEPEVYDTIFTEGEPDNLWPVTPDPREHDRRSLYLLRKRNVRLPLFVVFDAPDMMTSCGARNQSVHALQALTLMNSDFMAQQSARLAGRLLREQQRDVSARIRRLFLVTQGRGPTVQERDATERFLRDQVALLRDRAAEGGELRLPEPVPAGVEPAEAAAWVDLSLAALNLNGFVYLK